MFTDRFIKLPIKIYNKKEEELMGKEQGECEMIDLDLSLNPFDIESYRPAIADHLPFEEASMGWCVVTTKGGDSHLVYLHIDELETRLNAFGK